MVVAASIFTVSTVVGNKVTKTMPATTTKNRERKKKKNTVEEQLKRQEHPTLRASSPCLSGHTVY